MTETKDAATLIGELLKEVKGARAALEVMAVAAFAQTFYGENERQAFAKSLDDLDSRHARAFAAWKELGSKPGREFDAGRDAVRRASVLADDYAKTKPEWAATARRVRSIGRPEG